MEKRAFLSVTPSTSSASRISHGTAGRELFNLEFEAALAWLYDADLARDGLAHHGRPGTCRDILSLDPIGLDYEAARLATVVVEVDRLHQQLVQ